MKTVFLAVAASFALASAVPALAADNPATGRPAQLTQKLDDAGKDKAKGAVKKETRAAKRAAHQSRDMKPK